ncbi:MAG: thymidine phosphorylase [Mycoplasmatota bacterium]|nr:thymidine phosphorylase [Mycoplasmatota bacterium]
MNIIDIINKKRLKEELTDEEIKYIIDKYLDDTIKDYQMSSLLMAILLNGMTDEEIYSLTKYMASSGDKLDLTILGDNVVDKHSTGGIGDKTTLIISPLVASCQVKVAKMSGRGLGYTGGTIDKLESIPGFNVNLTEKEFIAEINKIFVAITSQTENIAIADKKIYALRDVTGTVESIPLIASSIMSKKIALGAKKLVLDVKVGKGALIKNKQDAIKLAKLMISIGKKNNIQVICLLTNMDIPLGTNIGNSLEIEEAIDVLKNKKSGHLKDLCIELATQMVSLGLNISYEEAHNKVITNLNNGSAYKKFEELIQNQHGSLSQLPKAKRKYEIKSMSEGYLTDIDAYKLGVLSTICGSGRITKEDKIDYTAGIIVNKNINDYIKEGDTIMTIYTNKQITKVDNTIFKISKNKIKDTKLILDIIK